MIVAILFIVSGIYFACGIIFALPFVAFGVRHVDSQAAHGSWGFRLLIIPGTVALWPLLLSRWRSSDGQPPVETNPHRPAFDRSGTNSVQL